MNNNLVPSNKVRFSVVIQTEKYQKLINDTLGDKERARRFIASISSAVAVNPSLHECTPNTIIVGALLGESLNLSPSPTLGQYYLVPFKNKRKDINGNYIEVSEAVFILGAKGYIQLAIRSGQYKDIDYIEVREGEYLGRNKKNGKQEFSFIEDEETRLAKPIIGYMAYFELINGFYKQIYWSKEKMEIHADTYSKAFNLEDYRKLKAGQIPAKDMWKYSSYWYKDFDEMAFKTLLRQLISKWGIMSIEMQEAYTKDTTVMQEDGSYEYVDVNNKQEQEIEAVIGEELEEKEEVDKKVKKIKAKVTKLSLDEV